MQTVPQIHQIGGKNNGGGREFAVQEKRWKLFDFAVDAKITQLQGTMPGLLAEEMHSIDSAVVGGANENCGQTAAEHATNRLRKQDFHITIPNQNGNARWWRWWRQRSQQ